MTSVSISTSDLSDIFDLVLKKAGVDLRHYKIPVLKRRISARMSKLKIRTSRRYLQYLAKHPTEITSLYNRSDFNAFSLLKQELASTQARLQSLTEEFAATTEELKSANEEIEASN